MLRFIDFEVFAHDWMCVIITPETQETVTVVNDASLLREMHQKSGNDVWVGFNIRWYDQYIFKAILLGLDPKKVNDWIVVKGRDGWQYTSMFQNVPLVFYDVMTSLDRGLKYFEGSMGNSIEETSVPFDIDRKLTPQEIADVIGYCTHDVEQTIEVFIRRKADFEAQVGLLRMFNLPLEDISKTKVRLSAEVLEARRRSYDDEFDISFPETLRLDRYRNVLEWYMDWRNRDYSKSLEIEVDGVPHVFGWGGVHGARVNWHGTGRFINMDVTSLYPSLMIRYNLHSRSCNPQKYVDIYHRRIEYKKERNPLQAPLKIVLNGTYGAMKDKYNPLYDPRQANNVCVYGQLLLLDLMEKLEDYADIIQSNTDGVLIRMPDCYESMQERWEKTIRSVCGEWQERTGLGLEFDEYVKVFQKDVNNYVMVDKEGHYKSKGAYVKKLGELDYDLAVVNRAMVEHLVNDVPVERTIEECNNLKDFQMVKKISSKYRCLLWGTPKGIRKVDTVEDYFVEGSLKVLGEKCVRVFASTREEDGGLFKLHAVRGNIARVEGTPEHAFMVNGAIEGQEVPDALDRAWYVELAKKRLKGFV